MHDIKFLRANAGLVKEHLANKHIDDGAALVDEVLQLDEQRRNALFEVEQLKKQRNEASQQVAKLKKSGEDATQIIEETRHLGDRIGALDADSREIEAVLSHKLLEIPNFHAPDVPLGAVEDDNVEVRKWGDIPQFAFEPKPHWEIGENLRIIDFERGAKVSGSRFYVLRGAGARLERALITLMLDVHTQQHGYEEILPPVLVREEAMTGAGVLPKFGDDAYHIGRDDLWLIPTAEVPVTALHSEEILDAAQLPIKYAAYSACFRSEAGAAGRDTRGLIRVHQFNKVELVKFVAPEDSYEELEKLTRDAEVILEMLELPYRTVEHCTGDLGFKATKSYDPEVWFPSQKTIAKFLRVLTLKRFRRGAAAFAIVHSMKTASRANRSSCTR